MLQQRIPLNNRLTNRGMFLSQLRNVSCTAFLSWNFDQEKTLLSSSYFIVLILLYCPHFFYRHAELGKSMRSTNKTVRRSVLSCKDTIYSCVRWWSGPSRTTWWLQSFMQNSIDSYRKKKPFLTGKWHTQKITFFIVLLVCLLPHGLKMTFSASSLRSSA